MNAVAGRLLAASFAAVAGICVASCSSTPRATGGHESTTSSVVVKFPSRSVHFVATPAGRHDLTSAQALAIAQRANAELKLPADTVAVHGAFTDMTNENTPVWGYHFHSCEVPHAPIKVRNRLCTQWVFLQSQDGSFVESTWSS